MPRALAGIDVSTGLLSGIRGRAARKLGKRFLAHVWGLLASAPALAMADTLAEAHHAARTARAQRATRLEKSVLARIRNHYRGALARGEDDNQGQRGSLATEA